MHCACIGGAVLIDDLHQMLERIGFEKVAITPLAASGDMIRQWAPGKNAQDYVVSAMIAAEKRVLEPAR